MRMHAGLKPTNDALQKYRRRTVLLFASEEREAAGGRKERQGLPTDQNTRMNNSLRFSDELFWEESSRFLGTQVVRHVEERIDKI